MAELVPNDFQIIFNDSKNIIENILLRTLNNARFMLSPVTWLYGVSKN